MEHEINQIVLWNHSVCSYFLGQKWVDCNNPPEKQILTPTSQDKENNGTPEKKRVRNYSRLTVDGRKSDASEGKRQQRAYSNKHPT